MGNSGNSDRLWAPKSSLNPDFLGSKITADGDCSHEIKRHLLLGRKAMTNLDSILKSRDITLLTKVHLVKAVVFPVVMYGCESWTIKKTECWRMVAFELWCWRRLLTVPWTARRSNQSILKEISPEDSVEELMIKLKPQYFCHMMRRTDSFEKTLMLGKIQGRRRRDNRGWDGWKASLTRWTWVWSSSRSWWWTGNPYVLQSMGLQRVRRDWLFVVTELKLLNTFKNYICSHMHGVQICEEKLSSNNSKSSSSKKPFILLKRMYFKPADRWNTFLKKRKNILITRADYQLWHV